LDLVERVLHFDRWGCKSLGLQHAAERDMKIYLLILLIGTLLAAVHFTSTPEHQSETAPQ